MLTIHSIRLPCSFTRNRLQRTFSAPGMAVALSVTLQQFVLAEATEPPPTLPIHRVWCAESPQQSYALYLPSYYTPDRKWPVVFCFDPSARGSVPVERFKEGAERFGFIVAGSCNSRNGSWDLTATSANAMMADVFERFSIDERRVYTAGFSGGARAACVIAGELQLTGVVACGATFPGSEVPEEVSFLFFGAAGIEDFNYSELNRVAADLTERGLSNRMVIFNGTHEWMPSDVATGSLQWLKLHAMKAGLIPPDASWLRETFLDRLSQIKSLDDDGHRYEELLSLIADFNGMIELSKYREQAAELKGSRTVRNFQKAHERSLKMEEQWIADLGEAIAFARAGDLKESEQVSSELRQFALFERTTPNLGGSDVDQTGQDYLTGGSRDSFVIPPRPASSGDRFQELRSTVRKLRRESARHVEARRALHSAFAHSAERGRRLLIENNVKEAVEALQIATLIKPEFAYPHYELSYAHMLDGNPNSARSSLEAAIARGFDDQERIQQIYAATDVTDGSVVELPPFLATDEPFVPTSFGISYKITADKSTRMIQNMLVLTVAKNSEAAAKGLEPGMEVLTADGRSVRTIMARFDDHGEFHRIFMNRRPGEKIVIEVAVSDGGPTKTVTLTEGVDPHSSDRPWQMPRAR